MSHTPGPWCYSFESVDPEWAVVTTSGGAIVANVNADYRQDGNARLIAAAPDLLEFAKAIIRWANAKCPCGNDLPDPCPLCGASAKPGGGACKAADETLPPSLLQDARAAISRAEGR